MGTAEEIQKRDESLEASKDPAAAELLRAFMSELSEEYYSAGWLIGLEFDLWAVVAGEESRSRGFQDLTVEEVTRLCALRERSGGWWYLDEKYGELFETKKDFAKRFALRRKACAR